LEWSHAFKGDLEAVRLGEAGAVVQHRDIAARDGNESALAGFEAGRVGGSRAHPCPALVAVRARVSLFERAKDVARRVAVAQGLQIVL
jgi:hypothetical protein